MYRYLLLCISMHRYVSVCISIYYYVSVCIAIQYLYSKDTIHIHNFNQHSNAKTALFRRFLFKLCYLTSAINSGCLSIIDNNAAAEPLGFRLPCSQDLSVAGEIRSAAANLFCDKPVF